jgi:hypothetical protein
VCCPEDPTEELEVEVDLALWPNPSFPFFKPREKKAKSTRAPAKKKQKVTQKEDSNSIDSAISSEDDEDGTQGQDAWRRPELRPRGASGGSTNRHDFEDFSDTEGSEDDSELSDWNVEMD